MIKYIPGHLCSLGLGDTQEHLQVEGQADLQTSQPCSTSLQAHQERFHQALPPTADSTPTHQISLLYISTFHLPSRTFEKLDRSRKIPCPHPEVYYKHDCSWDSHLDKWKAKLMGTYHSFSFWPSPPLSRPFGFQGLPQRKVKESFTVSLPT